MRTTMTAMIALGFVGAMTLGTPSQSWAKGAKAQGHQQHHVYNVAPQGYDEGLWYNPDWRMRYGNYWPEWDPFHYRWGGWY